MTIATGALAFSRFSSFLAEAHPGADEDAIDRPLLEAYMAWLGGSGLAANTRALSLIFIRNFLEENRRFLWLPKVPAQAAIYHDDIPKRASPRPRFVSEMVMAQLESEANLAKLEPTARHLVIALIETGLRAGDACTLAYDPFVPDSVGWPCLRFYNSKVHIEQLVPLSAKGVAAVKAQQEFIGKHWLTGSPWLFPDPRHTKDASLPFDYHSLGRQLRAWERRINLHDEDGRPVAVTAHQLRHTLGPACNSGVPQHVVQKLVGHASPNMTGHYAKVHDTTVREAFDRYQSQRVGITGERAGYDPDSPTAGAEWVKQNLNRVRDSLPNGYCARPAQQECPHPSACLTCPDFQTTPEFLEVHRRQASTNRRLIAQADAKGQFRLAENLRRVQANLERIIPALETIIDQEPPADGA